MKILIIGCGLIGLTTAVVLRRRGHDVMVLDRRAGAGQETSFANGALLTPGMAEPWNAPGCWRVLLGSLLRSDAPLQLRLRALPTLATWGVSFLGHSRAAIFERNALNNLRLALYSLDVMQSLRQQTGIDYGRTARGSLKIFRNSAALDQAAAAASHRLFAGLRYRRLSQNETIELEPALMPIRDQLVGALHYENDETGDAYRFCTALVDHARQLGVDFRFHTEVSSPEVRAGRVTALVSSQDRFTADRYVVAAGSYSTPLLNKIGIDLPVRPAKGYSITVKTQSEHASLRVPIVDDDLHAVVVPLDGVIRVAGTAEFAGYDLDLPVARIRTLTSLARAVLPDAGLDFSNVSPWCGLRAMSVDGVPIIGPTPLKNLFINTGHGHLGWTMATGSAELLTDLICGESTSIDTTAYELARFSTSARYATSH